MEAILDKIKKMPQYLAGLVLLLVILGVLVVSWALNKPSADANDLLEADIEDLETSLIESNLISQEIEEGEAETGLADGLIYVDVKGEVQAPGMFEMQAGDRVQDAILKAGGFTEEADQMQVNLAGLLTDQMMIVVPKHGQELAGSEQSLAMAAVGSPSGEDANLININTAEANELTELPGIGPKKAEQIIAHREANGSFQKIENLTDVSGIGEKTFEQLKDKITVQ